MEQLTIIGTEDGKLVVVAESGERYSIAIDDVLHSEISRARRGTTDPDAPRAKPRDIQTHIRAGLSAEEVAELLSTTVEDVQRYEAPVLAEREHVVTQALAVPVLMSSEMEPDGSYSFGEAIRAKISDLAGSGERWTSWKDESGWMIKLEFTAEDVDHDARWSFDPRRSTLQPQNQAATQLSRQGSLPEGLIPRLRALDSTPTWKDETRFDSGAFGPRRLPEPAPQPAAEPPAAPRITTVNDVAVKRAPEPTAPTHPDTADLLEALRRRRGQRESVEMPTEEVREVPSAAPVHAPSAPVNLFGTPEPAPAPPAPVAPVAPADEEGDDEEIVAEKRAAAEQQGKARKGRPSMPSWDEIVFGARTED